MSKREVATISMYPAEGHSHSSSAQLSALAAYSRSLLHALSETERNRHVVLTCLKQQQGAVFEDNGIEVHEVWQKNSMRFIWQILRAVRSMPEIKLVHLQHEFNQFGGAASVAMIPVLLWCLRFMMRKRVIITFHEVVGKELLRQDLAENFCLPVPVFSAQVLFRWYYRVTSFAAHQLLVQHVVFLDILRREMSIKTPAAILPIGTEDRVVLADRTASRAAYTIQASEKMLLFFGTIDWRKGLNLLLDAFDMLPSPGFRLIIGGGLPGRIRHRPEYIKWYRELSARIERHPAITQIGFVAEEDIPKLLAASDLVILPYVVPQRVSAVLNHAASYERPFICSEAFKGHAPPSVLFPSDAGSLQQKILWTFAGHEQELTDSAIKYKRDNSWSRSAGLLTHHYARNLNTASRNERTTDYE